jgi:hypothetical protein
MNEIILTNDKAKNLTKILSGLGDKADSIKIASAFFSDINFITNWLDKYPMRNDKADYALKLLGYDQ